MGGNAIKSSSRITPMEYDLTLNQVIENVLNVHNCDYRIIPFYSEKTSFGDIDIVVDKAHKENIINHLSNTVDEYVHNNDVFSYGTSRVSPGYTTTDKIAQVDLIFISKDEMDIASSYFAYNDLSNLLGRIAKKVGFKLAHNGLWYIEREGDHIYTNYCFSKDYTVALSLLGLSVERYKEGFDTLEDVFEYVISSPYFNRNIFLLENRNYTSRIRDKKRTTYMKFLRYLENKPTNTSEFQYDNATDAGGYGAKNNVQVEVRQLLFDTHPDLKLQVLRDRYEYELNKEFKKLFNGNIVREYYKNKTGDDISGKKLGDLMGLLKQHNKSSDKRLQVVKEGKYNFSRLDDFIVGIV